MGWTIALLKRGFGTGLRQTRGTEAAVWIGGGLGVTMGFFGCLALALG